MQQWKEADLRASQAAAVVTKQSKVIDSFAQEHRMLLQLAEQFEDTALVIQQRRAVVGETAFKVNLLSW